MGAGPRQGLVGSRAGMTVPPHVPPPLLFCCAPNTCPPPPPSSLSFPCSPRPRHLQWAVLPTRLLTPCLAGASRPHCPLLQAESRRCGAGEQCSQNPPP